MGGSTPGTPGTQVRDFDDGYWPSGSADDVATQLASGRDTSSSLEGDGAQMGSGLERIESTIETPDSIGVSTAGADSSTADSSTADSKDRRQDPHRDPGRIGRRTVDHRQLSSAAERVRRVAAACAAATLACAGALTPAAAAVPGQFWLATLDMKKAWTVSEGAGVTVAVVDSGVVASVGDLKGRVLPGVDLSGGGGDGQSDPGGDCAGSGGCYSHGTDMALRIAGTGAGAGFQGIAPKANILPVKVTARSGQQASPELIARGIRWAVDHGAQIINVSMGDGGGLCPYSEGKAAQYAYQHGVLVVAAIGNKGIGLEQAPSGCFGVLAVTATDVRFKPWAHTNFGFSAAFTAAGVDVPAETLSGAIRQHTSSTDGAAAIASGAFALIRAHFPTYGERALITRALWNVHTGGPPLGKQADLKLGYGEILPYYAMTYPIPATAANPIFDFWQRDFGMPAVTGAPTGAPPRSAPSRSGPSNGGITIDTGRRASGGSTSSTGLIIGVAAGLLVLLAVIGVVLRARRGSRAGG